MGIGSIGPVTLIFIIIVALLLFGPNKLPELGRALGRTLKEFKKGAKDVMADENDKLLEERKDVQQAQDPTHDQRRLPE